MKIFTPLRVVTFVAALFAALSLERRSGSRQAASW